MALNKKLIHFLKLADFNTLLAAGNILDTSIVFIKDAKQIYTHGQLYSCSYTESELQELLNNKADATDLTDILTLANQYTDDKVANLVGQAPEALDTVYELAEAMATNLDAVDVLNEAIGKKVDKVAGKGLSTNDYTTAEKDKLAGIAQGATANIGTITGIKMNGASRGSAGVVDLGTVITEHQNISHLASKEELNSGLLSKQNIISDLETIRSGAALGATSLQSEKYTSTEVEEILDKVKNGNELVVYDWDWEPEDFFKDEYDIEGFGQEQFELVKKADVVRHLGTLYWRAWTSGDDEIAFVGETAYIPEKIDSLVEVVFTPDYVLIRFETTQRLKTTKVDVFDESGTLEEGVYWYLDSSSFFESQMTREVYPRIHRGDDCLKFGKILSKDGSFVFMVYTFYKNNTWVREIIPLDIYNLATKADLTSKVDKVDGKQLSTEDFTTVLKQKLENIGDIPTKVSQLENDIHYITENVISDGVYAVAADGSLIDYNSADTTALGVALVAGEHKFMIAKNDATNGTNTTLYWGKNLYQKDVAGITNISSGADYIGEGKKYGTDFTTWSTGPVVDFNGAANTAAIIAGYTEHGVSMDARDMCTVLNTFNASDSYNDWYVPACGQLALMYLAKTDINAALAKIGGTALESNGYWSSSEYDAGYAWYVGFFNGYVGNSLKFNYGNRVRFVRDISVKSLKERVSELEELNAILVDADGEADDPENIGGITIQSDWNETNSTSGAYIKNKPTIPNESTVSGWGFTKNTGTYSKPSTGIPKSDLASAVLTSLGKADTALQSYTEQYKGTITGVSANGTSVATSGVANIPAASTSAYGVTKLSSSTSSTSTSLAATASAVKAAYDLANSYKGTVTGVKINGTTKTPSSGTVDLGTVITSHQDISGKQDKLVSGTNIKTINGESILGSGDIVISGGGSSSGSVYAEVNHGTGDTTFALTPNTFHVWDEVAVLDLSFADETAGIANEYLFQFTSGATATTLTLPDELKWANEPTIAENMIYQISVLKGLASVLEFSNAVALIENKATVTNTSNGEVQFQYPVASTIVVNVRSDMNYKLTFNEGDQTKSVGELSIDRYIITSINPNKDGIYNYTF